MAFTEHIIRVFPGETASALAFPRARCVSADCQWQWDVHHYLSQHCHPAGTMLACVARPLAPRLGGSFNTTPGVWLQRSAQVHFVARARESCTPFCSLAERLASLQTNSSVTDFVARTRATCAAVLARRILPRSRPSLWFGGCNLFADPVEGALRVRIAYAA